MVAVNLGGWFGDVEWSEEDVDIGQQPASVVWGKMLRMELGAHNGYLIDLVGS